MKGIIVPPADFSIDGRTVSTTVPDPKKFAPLVLYWDKIDWPLIPQLEFDNIIEVKLMMDEGILVRSKSPKYQEYFSKGLCEIDLYPNYHEYIIDSILYSFYDKNKSGEEEWILESPVNTFKFYQYKLVQQRVLKLDLYNALPVPTGDIEIESIIDFKRKRYAELTALQVALDEIYLRLLNSGDIPTSKSVEIYKLKKSLNDLKSAMSDPKFKWVVNVQNFSIKLDLAKLAIGVIGGSEIGEKIGSSIIGLLTGIPASMLNFSIDLMPKPKHIPEHLKAFEYAFNVDTMFTQSLASR